MQRTALRRLRRQRRPLGWFLASLVVLALAAPLGQCLAMDPESLPMAMTGERSAMPGEMPCADCTAGGEVRTFEEGATVPGSLKPPIVVALVVVSTLLAVNVPMSIPIPPEPLLPKRPRTLEFAVLQI